jgi:hypothetical protein
MLADELPKHRDDGFSRIKTREHDEIAAQIAEFERHGGVITVCREGDSKMGESSIMIRSYLTNQE